MSDFRTHKVVAALPAALEPNCIYMVRTGSGYRQYLTDNTGAVAHALIKNTRIDFSCRIEGTNIARWYGPHRTYGPPWPNWNGSRGTGPTTNDDNIGFALKAGDRLRRIRLCGRTNNNSFTDSLMRIYTHTPGGLADTTATAFVGEYPLTFKTNQEMTDVEVDVDFTAPGNLALILLFQRQSANGRYIYASGSLEIEQLGLI